MCRQDLKTVDEFFWAGNWVRAGSGICPTRRIWAKGNFSPPCWHHYPVAPVIPESALSHSTDLSPSSQQPALDICIRDKECKLIPACVWQHFLHLHSARGPRSCNPSFPVQSCSERGQRTKQALWGAQGREALSQLMPRHWVWVAEIEGRSSLVSGTSWSSSSFHYLRQWLGKESRKGQDLFSRQPLWFLVGKRDTRHWGNQDNKIVGNE